jgi:hypothetical protein
MRRLLDLILDAWDFFRPLKREEFGEFGIMFRNKDGNFVPMVQADMDALKADVDERIEDFWFRHEAKAFETHGEAILKPQ